MTTTSTATAAQLGYASEIKFKTSKLADFAVIDGPMPKVALKVLNNVTEKNRVTRENGRSAYIVTLMAIPSDKLAEAVERFQGKEEVNVADTNGLFLTMNIWANGSEKPALPMKGETINCAIDWVDNQEKTGKLLRVVGHSLNPATSASKFDLASIGLAPAQTEASRSSVAENEIVR